MTPAGGPKLTPSLASLRATATLVVVAALVLAFGLAASAQSVDDGLAALSAEERRILAAYTKAHRSYQQAAGAYWRTIGQKRAERRSKRAAGVAFAAADFVPTQPPRYTGPPEPKAILARLPKQHRPDTGAPRREPVRPMADYLAAALDAYGFAPERVSEAAFKRAYAREALRSGLTADAVVQVYAFETSGNGSHDLQSGFDPLTGKGSPKSSAVGYAQLVDATAIGLFVANGAAWADRLDAMAGAPDTSPTRRHTLKQKAGLLRAMLEDARQVENAWSAHRVYARSRRGMAIHALTLDGDIGPWLQVQTLKDTLEFARSGDRTRLSGAELELMNLAGPQAGLDMLLPVARNLPTANFFERHSYERNAIVVQATVAQLIAAIEKRMAANLDKPGVRAFREAFRDAGGSTLASE